MILPLALIVSGCMGGAEPGRPLDRPAEIPWQGFGVEWDPVWWQATSSNSGYDSAGWRLTLARLDTLAPQPVRVMLHLRWFTQDSTLKTWNWQGVSARSVFAHLAELKKRNIPVVVCEWGWAARRGSPERIFSKPGGDLYAKGIARLVRELVVERGFDNIRWISVGNEPDTEMRPLDGTTVWADLSKSVQAALEKDRVPVARLATEEGVGYGLSNSLSLSLLRGAKVAGYHSYLEAGQLEAALDGKRLPESTPLWLTEVGMPGGTTFEHPRIDDPRLGVEMVSIGLAAARRGASAVLAWTLHDVVFDFQPRSVMRWGLWGGPAEGWKLRPWARAWVMLSRAIPAGSLVSIPPGDFRGTRCVLARRPDGSTSLILANQSDEAIRLRLDPSLIGSWTQRFYDGGSDPGGSMILAETRVNLDTLWTIPPYCAFALRR